MKGARGPLLRWFAVGCLLALTGVTYPERAVSSTRTAGVLSSGRSFMTVASYDGGFISAWEDVRASTPEAVDSFVMRYTAASQDLTGFKVSALPYDQSDPVLGCIGVTCLVAWQQGLTGTLVRTIDTTSAALGTENALSNGVGVNYQTPELIVVQGSRYGVTWLDSTNEIAGRFVGANGVPQGAAFTIATAPMSAAITSHAVYSLGTTVAVLWREAAGSISIRAQVFDATTSAPIGGVLTLSNNVSSTSLKAALTGSGTSYLAVWCDSSQRLSVRRFNSGATVVDAAAVLPFGSTSRSNPQAVVDASGNFVIAWVENLTVRIGRVDAASLAVLTTARTLFTEPGLQQYFRLSAPFGNTTVASWAGGWADHPSWVQARPLTLDANLVLGSTELSPQVLSDVHAEPRVARLGEGFVAGWLSMADRLNVGQLQVIDGTGANVGPASIFDSASDVSDLALDSFGGATRIAWVVNGVISTAALDPLTAALSPAVMAGNEVNAYSVDLASSARGSMVVWGRNDGLSARLVELDGGVVGAAPISVINTTAVTKVSVTASSTQYAIAWWQPSLRVARYSLSGAPAGSVIDLGLANPEHVSIASDGTDFLLVYNTSAPLMYFEPVHGIRITGAGAVLDATALDLSSPSVPMISYDPSNPEVIFDGQQYQLTWVDRTATSNFDVHQRSISSTATLGPILTVPTQKAGREFRPVVAAGASGRSITAWLASDDGLKVARVFARTTADIAIGDGCLSTAECQTGFCIGAICSLASDGGSDAGAPDAGAPDAGAPDAGSMLDAGFVFDAGFVDPDAGGASADGGTLANADAGSTDGGVRRSGQLAVGCGCSSSGATLMWLVAAGWLGARRRSKQAR